MKSLKLTLLIVLLTITNAVWAITYDVKAFGATGNGTILDTDAINKAIDAAAKGGGGTVNFPAGTYLSYSIRSAREHHSQHHPLP